MLRSEKDWVLEQIDAKLQASGINELAMLRHMETKVRAMFAFTGWEDDCDKDAAETVARVREVLDWMDDTRSILDSSVGKTEGNK